MLSHIKSLLGSKAPKTSRASAAAKREGDAHRDARRLKQAAECYRQALSLDSANADAHYELGAISRQTGDSGAAIEHLSHAIERRPDFELAYRELFPLLTQSGQIERAGSLMDRGIVACPESGELHNFHGKILAVRGDHAAAAASFRKACTLAPGSAENRLNLGHTLIQLGEVDEAIANYEKAVWFDPQLFDGHVAMADALQRQGRRQEAIEHYREALALRPRSAETHIKLGVALQAEVKLDEAISSYRAAADLAPQLAIAHANLGNVLMMKGARQDAIASFERALAIEPGSNVVHILTALKGGHAERAPDEYVERLFDWYASDFDAHLVKGLGYAVPEKLRDLLQPHAEAANEKWRTLDLGCGTGLAAVAIAPFARSLVGVDLSSKMLDKARERNLYDRLERLDLVPMMQRESSSAYDLVLAADVLVYLGKLDELLAEARRLLQPGGYLAFSVESLDALGDAGAGSAATDRDYRLNETGRFAHARAYLARLREQNGFEELSLTETQSRLNDGKGVQGYLVVWRRPQRRCAGRRT